MATLKQSPFVLRGAKSRGTRGKAKDKPISLASVNVPPPCEGLHLGDLGCRWPNCPLDCIGRRKDKTNG